MSLKTKYNTYLQTVWGDSFDDVSLARVREVMAQLQNMDDEHGAFWVGMAEDEEFVLECDKDLKVTAVLPGTSPTEISYYAKSWEEVDELYGVFLAERFEELKGRLI